MKRIAYIILLFVCVTSFGQEMITNGTFDNGDNWSAGTSWTIGGGVASHDSIAPGGAPYLNIAGEPFYFLPDE